MLLAVVLPAALQSQESRATPPGLRACPAIAVRNFRGPVCRRGHFDPAAPGLGLLIGPLAMRTASHVAAHLTMAYPYQDRW